MAAAGEYWRTMQFSRTLAEGRNSSRRASFRFSNAPINGGSSSQHNAAAAERRPVRERRTPVEGEERRRGCTPSPRLHSVSDGMLHLFGLTRTMHLNGCDARPLGEPDDDVYEKTQKRVSKTDV